MPNRDVQEQKVFEHFQPSKWSNLSLEEQKSASWCFEYLLANEEYKLETLKEFVPSKWNNFSESQKLDSCQKLENTLALDSYRRPYLVLPMSAGPVFGLTNDSKKIIYINLHRESPFHILETISHESCHADQFDLIDKRQQSLVNAISESEYQEALERSGLSERDLLVMDWETCNYVRVENSPSMADNTYLYAMQLIETEAILESTKFLRKYSEYFRDEEYFPEFLSEKEQQIENLKECFRDEGMQRQWFMDRRQRVAGGNQTHFSEDNRNELNTVFSLENMNDCRFKVLERLNSWENLSKKQEIEQVALNELMKKEPHRETRHRKRPADASQPKEKKVRLGLG